VILAIGSTLNLVTTRFVVALVVLIANSESSAAR
jgi:hypothetical protein